MPTLTVLDFNSSPLQGMVVTCRNASDGFISRTLTNAFGQATFGPVDVETVYYLTIYAVDVNSVPIPSGVKLAWKESAGLASFEIIYLGTIQIPPPPQVTGISVSVISAF